MLTSYFLVLAALLGTYHYCVLHVLIPVYWAPVAPKTCQHTHIGNDNIENMPLTTGNGMKKKSPGAS